MSTSIKKNLWPKQTPAAMNAFYGDPDANLDWVPDPAWYAANMTKIIPPYQLWYPRDNPNGTMTRRATKFTTLNVNKKCSDSLMRILTNISELDPKMITKYELDICGGVFNLRAMRGSVNRSIHSWGSAIDLSHLINSWKKRYDPSPSAAMMPKEVIDIFAAEGWTWGGLWSTPDAMHFQAANI